ncbi:MAG: hypothetical protein JWP17_2303 [Solirubrobacterales bacterium]|jgi:hypothetical protein|nr:hypothetical protein [Solirubrobacterales bacterium]
MTHSEDDLFDDPTENEDDDTEDLGEDHRGDNPGYDLDEQKAIEDLESEQDD